MGGEAPLQSKKIIVDIKTRTIPLNHQIYLARPGKQSQLYGEFEAAGVIGPDLPRLDLTKGKALKDYTDLTERVKRAVRVRSWVKAGSPAASAPPNDLARYKGTSNAASIAQHLGIIMGYFDRAKKGDFALMYPHSFNQEAVLYEFVGEPTEIFKTRIRRFDNETVSTRGVKELARINKRDLPDRVLDIIQKPNAFVQLDFSSRAFFYNLAFEQYRYADESIAKFNVGAVEYNVHEDILLKAFLNYVTANVLRHEGDRSVPITDAAFLNLGDRAPELSSTINSPGHHMLRSQLLIPIVAAALFSLAVTVGPDAAAAVNEGRVTIGNSVGGASDTCAAQVSEAVVNYFKLTGIYDDWPKACEFARKAAEEAKITTGVMVKGK